MQTVETLNQGLKRAYTLTITAKDIDKSVDAEVKRMAPQMRMPGFRPGKVPPNLVRKMHKDALTQDALNSSIQSGVQSLMAEHRLRPAMQPSVKLADDYAPGKDAEVTVELEVLPDVPAPSINGLKLERLTVAADEAVVDARLAELAEQQNSFEAYPKTRKAAQGDVVVMDFVGKVDGEPFAGGTGTGMATKLGSGSLIPGFEEKLGGVKAGDEKQIEVTFPNDYQATELAGKPATFDLKIRSVNDPQKPVITDEVAKSLGLESLEQLRGILKGQAEQELNGLTRTHMKRKLLDQLAADHDFPVPPTMVEAEFDQIWHQLQHETEHEADPAAAKAELDADRDDYRAIAERRVRLGLLLSEIGQANGVEVTQQEMNMLVQQAAGQYRPEERDRFIEYIRQEPMAAAQLRAPLYEDKVVDFLFGKAEVSDREVTRAELEAAIESEDGFVSGTHAHDHDKPKPRSSPKKAPAAKKPAVKKAKPTEVTAADIEPAKPDDTVVAAEPVKKAATKPASGKVEKAPAKTEAVSEEAKAKPAARKPAAKKKADA